MFDLFKYNPLFPYTYIWTFAGDNKKAPDDVAEPIQKTVEDPISLNHTLTQRSNEDKQNLNIELSNENIIDQYKRALYQKAKPKRQTLKKSLNMWKKMAFEAITENDEVNTAGLIRRELSLILKNSAGVIGFKDFLRSKANTNKTHLLGITSSVIYKTIYEALKVCHPGLLDWHVSYKQVDCPVRAPFSLFLSRIVKENEPICFLVPDDVLSNSRIEYTRDELNWFLKNPEAMENTIFVFGCHNIRHEAQWNKLKRKIPSVLGFYQKEFENEAVEELYSEWQQKGWID